MTRAEYFENAENKLGRHDIEAVYLECYNQAVQNNDPINVEWFGRHITKAINNRWINTYVKPTGMLQ